MKKWVLLLCVLSAGCSSVAPALLPSLAHCSEVSYHRAGAEVAVAAKCSAGWAAP